MNTYFRGARVEMYADFKDGNGTSVNPTVKLYTIAPGESTPVLRAATQSGPLGHYIFQLTLDGAEYKPGIWKYRYESTGQADAAFESEFELLKSPF